MHLREMTEYLVRKRWQLFSENYTHHHVAWKKKISEQLTGFSRPYVSPPNVLIMLMKSRKGVFVKVAFRGHIKVKITRVVKGGKHLFVMTITQWLSSPKTNKVPSYIHKWLKGLQFWVFMIPAPHLIFRRTRKTVS